MIRRIPANSYVDSASSYVGRHGELFYDPSNPLLRLSDGATPGGLSLGGGVQFTSVNLTADDIANASTTAVLMIPAPGAGVVNVIVSASYVYYFGTTTFGGGSGGLYYGPAASGQFADDGDQSVFQGTQSVVYNGGQGWTTVPLTACENAAIYYATSTDAYSSGGDGTATINIMYWRISVTA